MVQSSPPQDASTAALTAAWRLLQQLQQQTMAAQARFHRTQAGIIVLAVTATLLAIMTCLGDSSPELQGLQTVSQIALVLVGLGVTLLYALSNRQQDSHPWLNLAAAASLIARNIAIYRTILQYASERPQWLTSQVQTVQQQLLETLGSDWEVQIQTDGIPELTAAELEDWLPSDYLHQRLSPQLQQIETSLGAHLQRRQQLRTYVFCCGVGCVLLPLLGPTWSLGVAAMITLGLGLGLWFHTIRLQPTIEHQSQTLVGLSLLRNYWQSLAASDRTGQAFFQLVLAVEDVIWSDTSQVSQRVQQALSSLQQPRLDLLGRVLAEPIPTPLEQRLREMARLPSRSEVDGDLSVAIAEEQTNQISQLAVEVAQTTENGKSPTPIASKSAAPPNPQTPRRERPHAFVVMPFGRKQGADGQWIDFNTIYENLIKPALETAGFESFRADEEASSGDILTDMFQELLLADLVVADLSIDNANVFYELGIRHAMRKRGVVHIQAGRAYMPFDILSVRTLPYHCDETGCPDPQFLEKDKQALIKMIEATWRSDRHALHSPIFNLLTGLVEPDRKSLRTPLATGYWEEYTTLTARIEIAQRQKRIGDVVLLAEEVSNPLIKEDIIAEAGKALKSMGNSALALKEYRQGLTINANNTSFRCEEAYHLHRIGQSDEAIVKLERVLADTPNCVDAASYLARIFKDMWKEQWWSVETEAERLRAAYEASYLLQKSIENYLRGYYLDQNEYYPGINALTLTAILQHLAEMFDFANADPDEVNYCQMLPHLKGAVQFCLESNLQKYSNDFWAALSYGDLAVCAAEHPQEVATRYKKALTLLWNNKFALQTVLGQLDLLKQLNFRPDYVEAGISALQPELERYELQERLFTAPQDDQHPLERPTQVFLFAGHMIDQPNREKPRFPAAMEAEAAAQIQAILDKLEAHSGCIAITPGIACGGDTLFIEACLQRNMRIEAYLPFDRPQFIQRSVSFAGEDWVERFYNIANHPNVTINYQPERLGPVPEEDNPFERNNRWALYSTLVYDIKQVRLIVLWNGEGGDAPGGTGDMVNQVRQLGGVVEHIDTTKFAYWKQSSPTIDRIYQKLETSS